MVTRLGHRVCGTAATFDDAVNDLHHLKTDLVITDIMLIGERTGIDLAQYINKHLSIPFIFQSSVTDPGIINAALKTHPLQFLAKPLNKNYLASLLTRLS